MVALKRIFFAFSLGVALAAATTLSAQAEDHHDLHGGGGAPHGGPHGGPHPGAFGHPGFHHDFRGRDFAHFSPEERNWWRGGGWHHEWHNGRYGWWWGVGGLRYYYPAPIYPYPTYVADTMWMEPVPAVPGYAPGYWYYCSANATYYPYTPTCPVPWTPVAPQ